MNASPQRDASLHGGTHQTRETLFYLDETSRGAPQPRPLIWGEGQRELTCQLMKEIIVGQLDLVCLCTCVIHENVQCVSFPRERTIPQDSREFFCSDQRLSVHVALQPTFIYVEAVTSRINPLFWRHLWFLLLSLFVNSIIFPLRFYQLCQASSFFVFFVPLVQFLLTSCVLIIYSIAFGCSCRRFFLKLLHLDEIKCIKHKLF